MSNRRALASIYMDWLRRSRSGKASQTTEPIVLVAMTTGNTVLDPLLGKSEPSLLLFSQGDTATR